jgi:hypothetical protein
MPHDRYRRVVQIHVAVPSLTRREHESSSRALIGVHPASLSKSSADTAPQPQVLVFALIGSMQEPRGARLPPSRIPQFGADEKVSLDLLLIAFYLMDIAAICVLLDALLN